MTTSFHLAFRSGSAVTDDGDGIIVRTPTERVVLRPLGSATRRAVLQVLSSTGVRQDDLEQQLCDEAPSELALFSYLLARLDRRGLLTRSVAVDGGRMTLVPVSTPFTFPTVDVANGCHYVLCRLAHVRRDGELLVLESPAARARILLHGTGALAVLLKLAEPCRLGCRGPDGVPADALKLLVAAGMVREDGDLSAAPDWTFADYVFHASSRRGRHERPVGAVYPFASVPPPSALPRIEARSWQPLDRPDMDRLFREDVRLSQALVAPRDRASRAGWLDARSLAELLFRTARVRCRLKAEVATPRGPVDLEFAPRPYPCGGSLYELDVYVLVDRCPGISPGLHYYDPVRHRLGLLVEADGQLQRALREGTRHQPVEFGEPAVMLVLVARFQRRAWKYASTAYANTFKNAGVLLETIGLVAAAMRLPIRDMNGLDFKMLADNFSIDILEQAPVAAVLVAA